MAPTKKPWWHRQDPAKFSESKVNSLGSIGSASNFSKGTFDGGAGRRRKPRYAYGCCLRDGCRSPRSDSCRRLPVKTMGDSHSHIYLTVKTPTRLLALPLGGWGESSQNPQPDAEWVRERNSELEQLLARRETCRHQHAAQVNPAQPPCSRQAWKAETLSGKGCDSSSLSVGALVLCITNRLFLAPHLVMISNERYEIIP